MLLMDECVSFRSDQGGLPGLYAVRRHHPLPKSLTEKERPSHFDNDRLYCITIPSLDCFIYLKLV